MMQSRKPSALNQLSHVCVVLAEAEASAEQNGNAQGGGGLLSSFVGKLGMSMGGTAGLTRQEIQPALVQLKGKLMERNVAEEIAEKCAAGTFPDNNVPPAISDASIWTHFPSDHLCKESAGLLLPFSLAQLATIMFAGPD